MEDRKLLSLQEIVADIHRSAEEIDEHCGGALGDSGFSEQEAGRSVTAVSYPVASTDNAMLDNDDASTGLPVITSASFSIKSEPQQEDDIDEILDDLENYEDIGGTSPLQAIIHESPTKSNPPISPILGKPKTNMKDSHSNNDQLHSAKEAMSTPHPTISKLESLIDRMTRNNSNIYEPSDSNFMTLSKDYAEEHGSTSSHVAVESEKVTAKETSHEEPQSNDADIDLDEASMTDDVASQASSNQGDHATDSSFVISQDTNHNISYDDSVDDLIDLHDTCSPDPSEVDDQTENPENKQNSPQGSENASSLIYNPEDSLLDYSLMTLRDMSQNQTEGNSILDQTCPVDPDEMSESLDQDGSNDSNHFDPDAPLEFSHAFKKDVATFVKRHHSINKASKHFEIPFWTISNWIRKLFKGVAEDWMEDLTNEEPDDGETIYTERFKNAVVTYVKRRRCAIEYAAETFGVEAPIIRDWRDNANKEKRQAMLSSIENPQLMERLGLDLHDIRRRRVAEDKKSDTTDIPNECAGFSEEFISAVVRYVKRRKCSIERASKTLNIPAAILRSWIQSTNAKVMNQKVTSKEKRQLRTLPQSSTPCNESTDKDAVPVEDSSGPHLVAKQPFVLWKLQKQNNSQIAENEPKLKHQQDGKHSIHVSSQTGSAQKMVLQHQGFYHFKRSVIIHARRTNSSIATAKHFGIPVNTVYAWARQDGIELQSVPVKQNNCSQEFLDVVRSFARKRKCSLIYAADMFKINPNLIMPWKKQQPVPDEDPKVLPSKNSADSPSPHSTTEIFKKPEETSSKTDEKWITEYDNVDPEEFRTCCNELFPEGQSQNRYSREYRINVMRHLVLRNIGVTETAKQFNMPRRTVYDWLLRWSEAKIRIQKRAQKKKSKVKEKIPPTALVNSELEGSSQFYMVDRNARSPDDNENRDETPCDQGLVRGECESSSDDPNYDPSKGDLNDNDRQKIKKEKNRQRSRHEALSSAQSPVTQSLSSTQHSEFGQPSSTGGLISSDRSFTKKTSALFDESPKYVQLRRIVEEASQQSQTDPSSESQSSVRVIEEKLERWIHKQISLSRTVTMSTMKFYALQFAAQLKIVNFVPTSSWCVSFLQQTGLGSSISYDVNFKNPEILAGDGFANHLETERCGTQSGENDKDGDEMNKSKDKTSRSELTEQEQQHRFEAERLSIVPLPPDMLTTIAGTSNDCHAHQSNGSSSDDTSQNERAELSNRKLGEKTTRVVLFKRQPKNVGGHEAAEETTQTGAKKLQVNPANETLISIRGQQFRSRIVAYARKRGINAAAKNYKVSEKYVRKWMGHLPDSSESTGSSTNTTPEVSYPGSQEENSLIKILTVERTKPFSLPKSSLLKFQDSVKGPETLKRISSDSMVSIAKEFSLETAKFPKFSEGIPTGAEAKNKFFYLDEDHVFLDHAGKGSRLQKSLKLSHIYQEHIESNPQFFYRKQFSSFVDSLQKEFADFIGSDPSDFIFIDTVISGMETVLCDLQLSRCSTIYYLNFSSDITKMAIKNICDKTGCQAQEEILLLPLQSQEDILSVISETLHEDTTLAIFDHCPINFGFMLPVKDITLLCHMKGVPVLINGSHGVGQDSLNLSYLGPDYYVGSCDQWLCSTKGCSFLYMKKEKQEELFGANGNAESPFQSAYSPKDSVELCSCMAVIPALSFWDSLGIDNIHIYCQCLLKKAVNIFQSRWDVELLAPFDMHGMACCVSLPLSLFDNGADDIPSKARLIEDQLYNQYKIDAPIICVQNKLYVRISVHIYNHLSDFEKLANAIMEMEADSS